MRYNSVYRSLVSFAGWPANHGAWQHGDYFLLGFMVGTYSPTAPMHQISPPFHKVMASSSDGGETWSPFVPNAPFSCAENEQLLDPPEFNLSDGNIIRVCGRYDTGGEDCVQEGGFYLSHNFGMDWRGPFRFKGLWPLFHDKMHNTSRTRVLGNSIFLSSGVKSQWGSDWTFEARHDGKEFVFVDTVARDDCRAVMPAVAEDGKGLRLCALRRKGWNGNWIDVYGSEDHSGWRMFDRAVGTTGQHNGNPPALAYSNGSFYLAYGDRSTKTIEVMRSNSDGHTWHHFRTLAKAQEYDLGYPQLFVRTDGQLVCCYYISYNGEPQHIEACIFDPR